jgi:hypothetical protein
MHEGGVSSSGNIFILISVRIGHVDQNLKGETHKNRMVVT